MKKLKHCKYKVVKKDGRTSAMIRNHNMKYCRYYKPRTTVYADDSTYGIFVFKTKTEAKNWVSDYSIDKELIIVRVLPIGKGKTPNLISRSLTGDGLNEHYQDNPKFRDSFCLYPPKGSITYPGVYVVD